MGRWVAVLLVVGALRAAEPTATLTVSVVDEQLQPVVGLSMSLWSRLRSAPADEDHALVTDAAGRARFTGLRPGPYWLLASCPSYHDLKPDKLDLAAGEQSVELVLMRRSDWRTPATLEVLVLGPDGRPAVNTPLEVDNGGDCGPLCPRELPLGGLRIALGRYGYAQQGRLKTDAAGRVRFHSPPGRPTICLTRPHEFASGQPVWAPPGRLSWARVYLANPATAERQPEAEPEPKQEVSGRLLGPAGQPLAGTTFWLWGNYGHAAGVAWTTDADGHFHGQLPHRSFDDMQVKAAGWSTSAKQQFVQALPFEFKLAVPARTLTGRVVDTDGQPVPGAVAWAEPWEDAQALPPPDLAEPMPLDPREPPAAGIRGLLRSGQFAVPCDATGRFAFTELDAQLYRVVAQAPGYGLAVLVHVVPSVRGSDTVLRLTRLGALAGVLLHPDGSPWPGAVCDLRCDRPNFEARVHADRAGRWSCDRVPPGRLRLTAAVPGCLAQQLELVVRAGATASLELRPRPGHELTGRVRLADGSPGAGLWVRARQLSRATVEGPPARETWTDADGGFRLTGLLPGEAELTVDSAAGRDVRQTVHLPRSQPLSCRLPRRGSLSGRVVDGHGQPLAGVRCSANPGPQGLDGLDHQTRTDAEGRFVLAGLLAGSYLVEALAGTARASLHSRLRAGETRGGLRLTLRQPPTPPTGALRGRVVQPDGTPAVGATVKCGDAPAASATTNAVGEFRLAAIPAGPHRLTGALGVCRSPEAACVVKAGVETTLPTLKIATRLVTGRVANLPPGVPAELCEVADGLLAHDAQGRPLAQSAGLLLASPYFPSDGGSPTEGEDFWPPKSWPGRFVDLGYLLFPPGSLVQGDLESTPASEDQLAHVRADGTFALPLTPGRHKLTVTFGGRETFAELAAGLVEVPLSGPATVDLSAVAATATLQGKLLMQRGQSDRQVLLVRAGERAPVAGAWEPRDGEFRLPPVPPGDYTLVYGDAPRAVRWQSVTLRANEVTTVTLTPERGLPLRGRVRGHLPPGLVLSLEGASARVGVELAPDGAFTTPGLPPGEYRCTLWSGQADKLVRVPTPVRVPGPPVTLEWAP